MSLEHSPLREGKGAPSNFVACPPSTKLAYNIPEAVRATGLSRSYLYAEIKAGRLAVRKAGSRTLIDDGELRRFIAALPFRDVAA